MAGRAVPEHHRRVGSPLIEQGREALQQGDTAGARSAATRALAQEDPGAGPQGEALELLGLVLYLEREYRQAAVHFEQAYAAYRSSGDRLAAGRAARAVAWINGGVLGDWAVQNGWLGRARSILEEAGGDGAEHAWCLVIQSFGEPDLAVRESLLLDAVAIGRRTGDADVEFEALSYVGAVRLLTDHVEEGLLLLDQAMTAACAGEMTDVSSVDSLFCGFFWACELVNDVPRADQWMRTAAARLMRERNVVAAFCRAHYGGILTAAGRWGEAESELLQAAGHFDQGMSERRAAAVIRLAELRVRQGRLEEAAQLLTGLDHHPDAVRTLAALHLARGETALAKDLLQRAAPLTGESTPTIGAAATDGPLLGLLVEVCLAEGDVTGAEPAAARLRLLAAQRGPYLQAVAALAEGRVAIARGDPGARGSLHDALTGFARAGLPMESAVARLELARALADTSPQVAVAEAKTALEEFERLTAAQHADAAGALLRRLGAPVRTGPKGVGALTKRELEVLRLVGAGLSNPEIGDRLYITRKTVEHHIGHLLAKLGLRNRAEAAAYAARENLAGR